MTLAYNSMLEDLARGAIDFDTDTFRAMLVTAAYVPNKDTHMRRSDVTGEVVGTGYTAGGVVVAVTVTKDLPLDRLDVAFAGPSWPGSTITARGVVIYKARGGAATADELVAYSDFGANVSSSGAPFSVTFTSPLRFQN